MKKTSTIVKEKNTYEISILINNTAYIKSKTGKTGLLNIKTGELIGELDNFYTIYDTNGEFYVQRKEIEDSTKKSWEKDYTLRFYDAKEERLIADGWKLIKSFEQYYDLCAVESPVDKKIHIFDKKLCRSTINIFDKGFDCVESLYSRYSEQHLVVTLNGKKGVYCKGKGLITPIEYDEIEKKPNITIFTKNNKKYFVCDGKDGKTSIEFDEIKLDEKHSHIVYCKSGNTTFIYNTNSQELLLKLDCEDIKFIVKKDDSYGDYNGLFYFTYKNNNKYGLVKAEMSPTIRKQSEPEPEAIKTILLNAQYDEIKYDNGIFYLKKGNKVGLYQDGRNDVVIEPNYDDITYLGYSYYAFYNGEYCDISKISSPLNPIITKCKIVEEFRNSLIFERNNTLGLLECDIKRAYRNSEDFVLDNYDNIKHLGNGYFELERNGKKGISYRASVIIPLEYDEIGFHFCEKKWDNKMVYFSLEKLKTGIELAKKRHWDYSDDEVEFVNNHTFEEIKFFEDIMVLRDKTNCFIYSYDEEKMLKVLPANTEISMLVMNPNEYDKKILYCINGIHYFYKDGKFEEVYTENNDFYLTTYESDSDSFEVRTYNKDEHDLFCSVIDSKEDIEAEKSLIEMSEKGVSRSEYPTLVLKRIKKTK